jgi:phage tail-like protein
MAHDTYEKKQASSKIPNTGAGYKAPKDADTGDPWGAHYFSFEIAKTEVAHFQECTGFKSTAEVFVIEEGGMNQTVHKRAGMAKWGTVTLKFASNASNSLIAWRDKYIKDEWSARPTDTCAIVMRNNKGEEIRRWTMTGVWPVSWEGPSMAGGSSALAIDTLEIAFDKLELGNGTSPTPPTPTPPTPDEFDVGPVQFEYDSAKLTPEGKDATSKVGDQLDKHPEVKNMWIEGHTCDLGSQAYNQPLSQKRADACKTQLSSSNPNVNYTSTGYGFTYPVAPNNSEANRSKNRRTQFFTTPRSGMRPKEIPYVKYPGTSKKK